MSTAHTHPCIRGLSVISLLRAPCLSSRVLCNNVCSDCCMYCNAHLCLHVCMLAFLSGVTKAGVPVHIRVQVYRGNVLLESPLRSALRVSVHPSAPHRPWVLYLCDGLLQNQAFTLSTRKSLLLRSFLRSFLVSCTLCFRVSPVPILGASL